MALHEHKGTLQRNGKQNSGKRLYMDDEKKRHIRRKVTYLDEEVHTTLVNLHVPELLQVSPIFGRHGLGQHVVAKDDIIKYTPADGIFYHLLVGGTGNLLAGPLRPWLLDERERLGSIASSSEVHNRTDINHTGNGKGAGLSSLGRRRRPLRLLGDV
ncbi:unnamed protein product [Cuscuta europaea]|uniref:Uncharacterized protein n=1 Tax=Cuscuta europaea TaxID=41803 RepID=A0A9P1EAE2_CUSEU|nr:unnamed protein product [Cuscuta europaea]